METLKECILRYKMIAITTANKRVQKDISVIYEISKKIIMAFYRKGFLTTKEKLDVNYRGNLRLNQT